MSKREEFHYSKGVAPIMWVFFVIAIIELFVVHFLVALKWPYIGWPLTILSAIGAAWILLGIRSFKRRPHTLDGDTLELNFGSLKSINIELGNIAKVTRSLEPGALEKKSIINLAGIAYPNRAVVLDEPVEKDKERVFIRLDDPTDFDRALEARQIVFE